MPTDDLEAIIKLMDEHIELMTEAHAEMNRVFAELAEKLAAKIAPPPDEGKSNG